MCDNVEIDRHIYTKTKRIFQLRFVLKKGQVVPTLSLLSEAQWITSSRMEVMSIPPP